uniref:Nucleosome assembly protein 1-like 1 n=1 Tax=Tetraselmis sp. GSL018 TaxID=582737 RepID=A0A061R8Y2_9CHLO|eukprot:CAMPEP_0177592734 /NCGR_PEP_ID=MMETSP0419_2-20121207/8724_1 /TAXON_ID=582737 /ORGANISM="Tetraselmis sp., Strain GSL018" /LENGTH=376 /DNA_ID=CAMNT_0019083633 /DNA_START=38 /DNA_END=1168 /DNA_ORIENTATION=+
MDKGVEDLKNALPGQNEGEGADDNEDPDFELSKEQAMELLGQAGGQEGLAAMLQGHLAGLIGSPSGFLESLPKPVRRRVEVLKDLQEKHDSLEDEYRKEKAALDAKYSALYGPLYTQRAAIVSGAEEAPPKEEGEGGEGEPGAEAEQKGDEDAPKGIPEFWLCVLRNNEVTEEQITEKDSEALKHLVDITWEPLEGEDKKGFKLNFFFEENPFFENEILTKSYHMVDEDDPILEHAEGTEIKWKPGKNLTVKTMKKKPKRGGKSSGKMLTKTEPCESFFNFFSPPKIPGDGDELEEEEMEQLQEVMEADYDMGAVIKEKLIPHAVSWFTGEAVQLDDDDDDDDEDDDDDDDDDEKDGEGPEGLTDTGEKPPECKQQ